MLISMINQKSQEDQIHGNYKILFRISPGFYNFAYQSKKTANNILFKVNNRKHVKSISHIINDQTVRDYNDILSNFPKLNSAELTYPKEYAVTKSSGLIIYSVVRSRKPDIVLETWVANGFSTRVILCALEKNKKGTLYSTEVNHDVGSLLSGMNKSRWHLNVGTPKTVLAKTLKKLQKIDIFIHDSDHSYENMRDEFNAVSKKVSKDGIIMSDDVNENRAFVEFAQKIGAKPVIVPFFRKSFGIIYNRDRKVR